MNVVSLCSGVGLIDLGLEWAGYRTVQFCEINPFGQRILAERFPGVPIHDDAWTIQPAACDVIAAGFPCQPFSVAGKGLGADDPRHLWPAISRAIRVARPRFVILENVPGLLARGVGDVLGDLADAGFDAEWSVFSAADVGAPHLRRRVWIVATSDADCVRVWDEHGGFFREGWGTTAIAWAHGQTRPMAYADCEGELQQSGLVVGKWGWSGDSSPEVADATREREREPADEAHTVSGGRRSWPEFGGRSIGIGWWWSTERGLDRVAHGQPHRLDRLAALGNGVVPQCAELVGLRLRMLADGGA